MGKKAIKKIHKKKKVLKQATQGSKNITMDSKTGLLVDTKTGQTYDPKTGQPIQNALQARFGTSLTSAGSQRLGTSLGNATHDAQQAYATQADERRRVEQENNE